MGAYVDRQLVDHDLKGLLQIAGPKFSNLECSIEYELLEAKCRSASRDRLCPQHLDQYEVCFHLQLVPFEMRNQQHQLRLCACNPLINTTLMASSSKGAFQLQEYPRASDSVFQSQPAPLCQKASTLLRGTYGAANSSKHNNPQQNHQESRQTRLNSQLVT